MQFTAKNVDEAIELGLKEMNLTKEQVEIEIIEQVQKSLFKKGHATVEITKKITDEYDIITCEKLTVQKMLKEHNLSKKISDDFYFCKIKDKTSEKSNFIGVLCL